MADLIFISLRDLRESLVVLRRVEDWIVAEPTAPARCVQKLTVHPAADDGQHRTVQRQSNRAHKVGPAIFAGRSVQFSKNLRDAILVGRVGSRISSGPNSGSAVKCRYNQSGVIGKDQAVEQAGIMQGFTGGVFSEGRRTFVETGKGREAWQ